MNVPHPHAIERLSEQHETPSNLRLLLLIAGPGSRSDPPRAEEGEQTMLRLEHPLEGLETSRIGLGQAIGAQPILELDSHSRQPLRPGGFIQHGQRNAFGVRQIRRDPSTKSRSRTLGWLLKS